MIKLVILNQQNTLTLHLGTLEQISLPLSSSESSYSPMAIGVLRILIGRRHLNI